MFTTIHNIIPAEFLRFAITGVINTLAYTLTFIFQVEVLSIPPLIASGPSFCIAVVISYSLNRNWVFKNPGGHMVQFMRFLLVSLSALGINLLTMYLCLELWALHYLVSIAVTVFILANWNYGMNKFWTFKTGT